MKWLPNVGVRYPKSVDEIVCLQWIDRVQAQSLSSETVDDAPQSLPDHSVHEKVREQIREVSVACSDRSGSSEGMLDILGRRPWHTVSSQTISHDQNLECYVNIMCKGIPSLSAQ